MKWHAYPGYMPSGVEWVGEIPEHWDGSALKRICIMTGRIGFRGYSTEDIVAEDEGAITLSPSNMKNGEIDIEKCTYISWDKYYESPEIMVFKDDILMVKTGSTYGKVAYVGHLDQPATVNPQIMILKKIQSVPKYVFYITMTVQFQSLLGLLNTGSTIPTMTQEAVGRLGIPMPPMMEQRQIAAFLDRETARMDALMEKKQRQIDLLQEKRAALISHTVTKGLDPNAPMKDSGVEWLGHIPAHWELKRLKFAANIQTGLTLGKDYKDVPTISRPYLRVANVQDGYLDLNEITEIFIPEGDTKRHELKHGDVLMTEGGDFDKLGRGYVWEGQIEGCLHQNHIFAVRPNPKYLAPLYLATLMTSSYGKAYFTSTSQQTTNLATTNITKLKNYLLPLPNIREQYLILDWLGENISKIDGLSAKIQDSIDKLKEYRTALISAAVTGQIDVREEAA